MNPDKDGRFSSSQIRLQMIIADAGNFDDFFFFIPLPPNGKIKKFTFRIIAACCKVQPQDQPFA